jgi:hypothetical protein
MLVNRNSQLNPSFHSRPSKYDVRTLRVKFSKRQMADSHREEEQLNLLEEVPRGQQQQQNLKLG